MRLVDSIIYQPLLCRYLHLQYPEFDFWAVEVRVAVPYNVAISVLCLDADTCLPTSCQASTTMHQPCTAVAGREVSRHHSQAVGASSKRLPIRGALQCQLILPCPLSRVSAGRGSLRQQQAKHS